MSYPSVEVFIKPIGQELENVSFKLKAGSQVKSISYPVQKSILNGLDPKIPLEVTIAVQEKTIGNEEIYLDSLLKSCESIEKTIEVSDEAQTFSFQVLVKKIHFECSRCETLENELRTYRRSQETTYEFISQAHLQNLIDSLKAQLRAKENLETELQKHQELLAESHESRKELQNYSAETTQQLYSQIETQHQEILELNQEKEELTQKLRKQQAVSRSLALNEEKLKCKVTQLEGETEELKSKASQVSETLKMLDSVKEELNRCWAEKDKLSDTLENYIADFETRNRNMEVRIQNLTEQNNNLVSQKENLQKELNQSNQEVKKLKNIITTQKNEITELQAKQESLETYKEKIRELETHIQDYESYTKNLNCELQKNAEIFSEKLNELYNTNLDSIKERENLQEENSNLYKELDSKTSTISKLQQENQKLLSEYAVLEQHVYSTEDLKQILNQLKEQNYNHEQARKKGSEELSRMHTMVEQESLKNQKAQITIKKLQNDVNSMDKNIQDMDEELHNLREVVSELQKQRPVYVPCKDDPVDIAMSDYLNTRNQPLEVPFVREDMGIYYFGSKRIFVKMEQGKLIIRVGGGFMQVDEFVEIYSPIELDKFEKKQSDKAHRMRRSILGEYADHLVSKKSREMSPQKSAKFLKDQMTNGKYATCYAVRRSTSPAKRSSSPNKSPSPVRSPKKHISLPEA